MKPQLEPLEDRTVPSTYCWEPISTANLDWRYVDPTTHNTNWVDWVVPGSGDPHVRIQNLTPSWNDDVFFGSDYSVRNCYITYNTSSPGRWCNSLKMASTYFGSSLNLENGVTLNIGTNSSTTASFVNNGAGGIRTWDRSDLVETATIVFQSNATFTYNANGINTTNDILNLQVRTDIANGPASIWVWGGCRNIGVTTTIGRTGNYPGIVKSDPGASQVVNNYNNCTTEVICGALEVVTGSFSGMRVIGTGGDIIIDGGATFNARSGWRTDVYGNLMGRYTGGGQTALLNGNIYIGNTGKIDLHTLDGTAEYYDTLTINGTLETNGAFLEDCDAGTTNRCDLVQCSTLILDANAAMNVYTCGIYVPNVTETLLLYPSKTGTLAVYWYGDNPHDWTAVLSDHTFKLS